MFEPVRSQWRWTATDRLQAATGRLPLTDRAEIGGFLNDACESLPEPINSVERLILHWLLLQFAAESGNAIHARVHAPAGSSTCPFIPWLTLEDFFSSKMADPVSAFRKWVDAYIDELNRIHPMSPANKAAQLLRDHYQQQWEVDILATRVHATRTQVTRGFRREYGMSIGDYQRYVRLFHAIDRVRQGEKVDAIALEVGYKSKKNLYHAFSELTGLSLTEFRRLPSDAIEQIMDSARLALTTPAPRRSAATPIRHTNAHATDSSRRTRRQ